MFVPGDDDGGVEAGDVSALERCTAPLATPVGAIGVPGDSRMRDTLRAISSASSSAGSVGFDTFAGSRVCFEY